MVDFVTLIDNFGEVYFPESSADIYEFLLHKTIDGLKFHYQNDQKVVEITQIMLDSILISFKNKIHAEKDMEKGIIMSTKWGKGLAVESMNEEAMTVALKNNYKIIVRKDTAKGYIRIKSFPSSDIDLTALYQKIEEKDQIGTWFFHASKHMILNGSSKNRSSIASPLSLSDIIEIITKI